MINLCIDKIFFIYFNKITPNVIRNKTNKNIMQQNEHHDIKHVVPIIPIVPAVKEYSDCCIVGDIDDGDGGINDGADSADGAFGTVNSGGVGIPVEGFSIDSFVGC
jgi:hypothetical protein